MCLCVLSSVHEDTSRTTCTIFIKFFCACCLCPGLVLWHIDDRLHRLSLGRGDGSAQRGRSVIYDCLVFRLLNACCQFVSSSVSSPHADSMNNVLVGWAHWHHLVNRIEPSVSQFLLGFSSSTSSGREFFVRISDIGDIVLAAGTGIKGAKPLPLGVQWSIKKVMRLGQWLSQFFVFLSLFRHWVTSLWISLSLSLLLRPNFRLRPNLIQKVKWRFWYGLSQSLGENFRRAFRWVRTLDSAIRSAKVNLNNSVLVQFTLPAVDSLIP